MTFLLAPLYLLQHTVIALWGIFWISLAGIAGALTLNPNLPLAMARRCWAPLHWRITGSRLSVEALPEVDWSKPHIFIMNHQSMMDIPCAFAVIPANIRFVMQNPADRVTYGDLRMIREEFDELMELSIAAGTIKHPIAFDKYVDEQFARKATPAVISL